MASDPLGLSFDDAEAPAAAAPPEDLGLDFSDAKDAHKPPAAPAVAPAGQEWGPGLHFLDAMLMGHLPWMASVDPARMEAAAAGGAMPEAGPAEAWKQHRLARAQEEWAQQHGIMAPAMSIAGATAGTLPAMMVPEAALARVAP